MFEQASANWIARSKKKFKLELCKNNRFPVEKHQNIKCRWDFDLNLSSMNSMKLLGETVCLK
jgi:hypothetical protein